MPFARKRKKCKFIEAALIRMWIYHEVEFEGESLDAVLCILTPCLSCCTEVQGTTSVPFSVVGLIGPTQRTGNYHIVLTCAAFSLSWEFLSISFQIWTIRMSDIKFSSNVITWKPNIFRFPKPQNIQQCFASDEFISN